MCRFSRFDKHLTSNISPSFLRRIHFQEDKRLFKVVSKQVFLHLSFWEDDVLFLVVSYRKFDAYADHLLRLRLNHNLEDSWAFSTVSLPVFDDDIVVSDWSHVIWSLSLAKLSNLPALVARLVVV